MKKFLPLLLCLLSCNHASKEKRGVREKTDTLSNEVQAPKEQARTEWRIKPGESIGRIRIGSNAETLEALLGRPDRSNGAMGKAWLTWTGRRDEHNNTTRLDIYTSYSNNSMEEKIVRQIRTTSSEFTTEKGTGVYASIEKVKAEFPGIKKTGSYHDNGRTVHIYDDMGSGIAFEFISTDKEQICTGIIVHEKAKAVNEIYITLHPDMITATDVPG